MNNQKQKNAKKQNVPNVLENLKEIGTSAAKTLKEDLVDKMPGDFMDQLFGTHQSSFSGEINPGEAIEFGDVMTGRYEEEKKLNRQIAFERRMLQEDRVAIERKTNELKMELKAIMNEVLVLSKSTMDLGEEIELAAMQAPVEPGIYHLIFFEKLLEFIKSFRRKIDAAGVWLGAVNKRAQKKNYWGMYKKHGGSFLLSGEHYSQRSAG